MYRQVETAHDLAQFNQVWETVWREKGYELEYSRSVLARYVVTAPEGQVVGTSEIKRYIRGQSEIDGIAPFAEHPSIIASQGSIGEIDKFALLRQFRGLRYSAELMSTAVHCCMRFNLKYCVTLLEPVFCRALRVSFKVPMEQIAEKAYYKGDYVIPIVFDVEQFYQNAHRYDWITLPDLANAR
ncbi:hypothetical protein PCCS19_29320 [Paenibacillus sp. CCS19]|uniref:hypothetical protein n=1 Tax=Paenibacillus sp. CCS19 TaxID=3158387 RepID=UPI00256E484B|nr:hypothetical protein [Paenibacillus cellulosilyticus]GMK39877.1 hypothetical protein PCCS19_29320 [Paenibacillus cellulosilyticus]